MRVGSTRKGFCRGFGLVPALMSLALFLPAVAGAAALKPGDVLVVDHSFNPGGAIIKVDPATGKQSILSSNDQAVNASSQLFSSPWQVVIDPKGRLLVVDYQAFGGTGGVIAVDPTTGEQTLVSSNEQSVNASSQLFAQPTGIVRLPSGRLVLADNRAFDVNEGGLIAVNPGTGKQSVFSNNDQAVNASSAFLHYPYDLVLDGNGGVLVANSGDTEEGNVLAVKATGKQRILSGNEQPVNASSQFFDEPSDILRTAKGQIYVTDDLNNAPNSGAVIGVNAGTGKQRIVSSNDQPINSGSAFLDGPYGIAMDLQGQLLIGDEVAFSNNDGGVIGVNPATGKQSEFSSNDQAVNLGSSEFYAEPNGVMVVPPLCAGRFATIVGSRGRDKLRGTKFPDVIVGLSGRDTIRGLGANDRICGGPGPDRLFGGPGRRDRVKGGPGRDLVVP